MMYWWIWYYAFQQSHLHILDRLNMSQDIFAALYPTSTPMMPGWQRAPQFGMGYGMQYPAGVVSMSFSRLVYYAPEFVLLFILHMECSASSRECKDILKQHFLNPHINNLYIRNMHIPNPNLNPNLWKLQILLILGMNQLQFKLTWYD